MYVSTSASYIGISSAIQLYCEVDASYLINSDSKGHTGYTLGLHPNDTFFNRSAKQPLVSTHAEMRALYTLYCLSYTHAPSWDNGQLYRLHMIRAQAVHDLPRLDITEEDIDNYLIRIALSDKCTTTMPPVHNRWIPWGKRTITAPNRRASSSIDR